MKIYTPVKDFNGYRNNVRFINGVGETNDHNVAEWFRNNGYKVALSVEKTVEKRDEVIEKPLEKSEEIDFNSMTPTELRDWMRENGYGSKIKNTRDKEKLLNILRG